MPRGEIAPLATPAEVRGARPPRQLRSAELLHRITAAGRELLETRAYEDVSVADIAARAGISVGAFYTRFPSKERLVGFLVAELADELRDRVATRLEGDWGTASLGEIIGWYLRETAAAFLAHRGILRPATLIARETRDAELRTLLASFNADIHGRFRALLARRTSNVVAIDVAILMISAAMREVLLYGEPVSRLAPAHRQLIDELTDAAVAYLDAR